MLYQINEPQRPSVSIAVLDYDRVFHFILKESIPFWAPDANVKLQFFVTPEELLYSLLQNAGNPDSLPDLIQCELDSVHFDGFQFLENFRRMSVILCRELPVCVVSNTILKSDRQRLEEERLADLWFEKPVHKQTFHSMIALGITSAARKKNKPFSR